MFVLTEQIKSEWLAPPPIRELNKERGAAGGEPLLAPSLSSTSLEDVR